MKKRMVIHGEAIFYEIETPIEFSDLAVVKGQYVGDKLIVANSETSGNHHVMEVKQSDIRERLEQLYINNTEELIISCIQRNRHDAIVLPIPQANHIWVRTIAQEHDHITEEKRNVAD